MSFIRAAQTGEASDFSLACQWVPGTENNFDNQNLPPVAYATSRGHLSILEQFKNLGAIFDYHVKRPSLSVWHFCLECPNPEVISFIERHLDTTLAKQGNLTPTRYPYQGITPLLHSIELGKTDASISFLQETPDLNINAYPSSERWFYGNAIWTAIFFKNWELTSKILEMYPEADVNACPERGPNKGISALWLACYYNKPDLLSKLIRPNLDLRVAPREGPETGKDVLWMLANRREFYLLNELLTYSTCPIRNTSLESEAPHVTTIYLAVTQLRWDIVEKLIARCNHLNLSAPIEDNVHPGAGMMWILANNNKWKIVNDILDKFDHSELNFNKPTTPYTSSFMTLATHERRTNSKPLLKYSIGDLVEIVPYDSDLSSVLQAAKLYQLDELILQTLKKHSNSRFADYDFLDLCQSKGEFVLENVNLFTRQLATISTCNSLTYSIQPTRDKNILACLSYYESVKEKGYLDVVNPSYFIRSAWHQVSNWAGKMSLMYEKMRSIEVLGIVDENLFLPLVIQCFNEEFGTNFDLTKKLDFFTGLSKFFKVKQLLENLKKLALNAEGLKKQTHAETLSPALSTERKKILFNSLYDYFKHDIQKLRLMTPAIRSAFYAWYVSQPAGSTTMSAAPIKLDELLGFVSHTPKRILEGKEPAKRSRVEEID